MRALLGFPVRNPHFSVVILLMLVALGLASWSAIPRSEDPPLDFPTFMVVAVHPGASPADLERLVVRDLEAALLELDDVITVESRLGEGVATVRVEFETRSDADDKYAAVLRQMNALRPDLPPGLVRFQAIRTTMLDVAVAQAALVSETLPYHELDVLARELTDQLRAVPGVRTAEHWGAPRRQVEVVLDLGRLAELGLAPSQVLAAISGESADLPAGAVETGGRRFVVRASGSYQEIGEIAATVVRAEPGHLVRVADVAEVRWGYAEQAYAARYDGERALFVTVTQQDGFRIDRVRDGVAEVFAGFEARLPAGVVLARGFDQASNVERRLSRLQKDFVLALVLVLLMLLPLGPRPAGIVMLTIPLSLALGITLLHVTGFTLNQLTIVGAVLSLGLIVDDAIVVTENIARFLREGHSRVEAAIEGTRQLASAVIGSSLTLAFAFLPLLVLPGRSGMYLQSLPVAVIYMVAASLLVSLLVIPFLASRMLPREEREGGGPVLQAFVRGINRTYAPVLDRALARPRTTVALCAAFCIASFLLIPVVGFSLFPRAETPQFYISVTAPDGSSVEVTDEAVRHAERVVLAHPEVRAVFSSVGHDNPRVYYNVYPRRDDARVGQLFVLLDRYHPRRTPVLLDSIRAELARHPGARLELKEFENGPPVEAPIALRVVGPELETLRRLAGEVEGVLKATPGTRYVHNPLRLQRTDLRVSIDRAKAGMLGVPTLEVDRTLRMSLAGLEAGVLREADGEARPVVVRASDQGVPGPEILDRLQVASLAGALVPLRQIASFGFETAAPEIERVDRERAVTVTGDVRTGFSTDRVSRAALEAVEAIELPPGYRLTVSGEMASRRESFGGIGNAIIIALFAVLAILVLEFGSFRGMVIVASVIPLGAMGGVLALLLTGNSLSFTATIGFAALIGIDVKTSILLVDFTNQLRRQGVAMEEAIRRAGEARFLPIVLTSLTAIGALLPLALAGDALYSPLAWVIIGGLVSSTILGRVLTPVLYWMLAPPVPGGIPAGAGPAPISVTLPEIPRQEPRVHAGV